ncbi:MAG: sigma-70 family RNA polymerase sigma factor [Nitriliruptorales bacterium]|nr:sigma-70 family RNA polymerase sigma factor [Nitriliruptorales bacterium]
MTSLLRTAVQGDQHAWDQVVLRFSGLVRAITRAHRLSPADAADVAQTTWLRLVEHAERIRDPEHVDAWLATTARRECLRVIRGAGRQVPTAEAHLERPAPSDTGPEAQVLTADRDRALRTSLTLLSDRCQLLLRMLMAEPPLSYEEVSAALSMPIGSIGPTRARCLERLRRIMTETEAVNDSRPC